MRTFSSTEKRRLLDDLDARRRRSQRLAVARGVDHGTLLTAPVVTLPFIGYRYQIMLTRGARAAFYLDEVCADDNGKDSQMLLYL